MHLELNYYSYYLHTTKYYLDWLKRGTESRSMQHAIYFIFWRRPATCNLKFPQSSYINKHLHTTSCWIDELDIWPFHQIPQHCILHLNGTPCLIKLKQFYPNIWVTETEKFDHSMASTNRPRACEKMQIIRNSILHDVVLAYTHKIKMAVIEREAHPSCLAV